jgi:para-nitrobenzyl esterase
MIAALQWVHDNAGGIGADPAKVTVFGQSWGAVAMYVMMTSPKAAGLFSSVIVESGAPDVNAWTNGPPTNPLVYGRMAFSTAIADELGTSFAASAGCADASTLLSCMRAAPVASLLTSLHGTFVPWPVVDGYVLPADPGVLLSTGAFNKVPIIIGNVLNELGGPGIGGPATDSASFLADAENCAPGQGAAVVAEYPISDYGGSYATASAAMWNDGFCFCPSRRIARASVAAGAPTYRYMFDHAIDVAGAAGTSMGAFHGSELLLVFGNTIFGASLQPNEVPLSKDIMGYWGSLTATGNPNGGGRLTWPAYDLTTEPNIVLDLTLSTETQFRKAQCDFWDSLASGGAGDAGVGDAAKD